MVERVISIGGRLQKLLDEAESKAERAIADAQQKAREMISQARAEAENRRIRAQRGDGIDELLHAEEEKAKKEAAEIREDYHRKAEALKEVPEEQFGEAIELVIREVLPK